MTFDGRGGLSVAVVFLSVESQSVVKVSDLNPFSSFFTLFLKLLDFINGVRTLCPPLSLAISASTGGIATQVPGEEIYPGEVMAAELAEHYTEKRKD